MLWRSFTSSVLLLYQWKVVKQKQHQQETELKIVFPNKETQMNKMKGSFN